MGFLYFFHVLLELVVKVSYQFIGGFIETVIGILSRKPGDAILVSDRPCKVLFLPQDSFRCDPISPKKILHGNAVFVFQLDIIGINKAVGGGDSQSAVLGEADRPRW